MKRLIKLFFSVFGRYKIRKYERIYYFPTIFSAVITKYFSIPTYLSAKCRIPSKILKGSRENKIAALLTVLHDDGNVSGNVKFLSSNENFIKDLKYLIESLGYRCNISTLKQKGKMKKDSYSLALSHDSVEKFAQDCDELILKYPSLHIGRKLNRIKEILKFNHRNWKQRKKFETKKIILKALKTHPKTAFELREIANINL